MARACHENDSSDMPECDPSAKLRAMEDLREKVYECTLAVEAHTREVIDEWKRLQPASSRGRNSRSFSTTLPTSTPTATEYSNGTSNTTDTVTR